MTRLTMHLPNDEIYDAEVKYLLLGIVIRHLFFLFLNLTHQLLSLHKMTSSRQHSVIHDELLGYLCMSIEY